MSKQGTNLMDLLEHRNETFILAEAIGAAGLDETLRKQKGATLFAPTDAAFAALLEELKVRAVPAVLARVCWLECAGSSVQRPSPALPARARSAGKLDAVFPGA